MLSGPTTASPAASLTEIAGLVKQKHALLLVGAGATERGGGLLWDDLATKLRERAGTPRGDHPQETIDFACSNMQRRSEAYAFIQERLSSVSAPPELADLLSHPWPVVLTTNYDTAVEDYYRQSKKVLPKVHLGVEQVLQLGVDGLIPVLKLSGCRTIEAGRPGEMVVSSTDRERHRDRTGLLYRHLEELVQVQAIVTVGYSFRDEILTQVIQRVRGLHANANLRIYAVFPEAPTTQQAARLELHQVVPVQASMVDLANALKAAGTLASVEFVRVQHGDSVLHVPGRRLREVAEAFEPITETAFHDKTTLKEFLEGKTRSYTPHVSNQAWKRPEFHAVMGYCKEWRESSTKALLLNVSGKPGNGRTTLSYAVASQLVAREGFVGLRSRPGAARLSADAARSFISAIDEVRKAKGTTLVVQCDEVTSLFEALYFLRDLANDGHKVVLIRTSVQEVEADKYGSDEVEVGSVILHSADAAGLANYIAKLPPSLGAPQWSRQEIERVLNVAPSFIDAMYTFVHPYRKSLGDIVQERMAKMGGTLRDIVEACAIPTLAGGEIPIPVLARTFEPDYVKLFTALDKNEGLLVTTGTTDAPRGVALYHQRVANCLMENHSFKRQALKQFHRVLENAQLQSGEGHDMAERVLVRHEGSLQSVLEETYGPEEVSKTWSLLDPKRISKLLLHHMGRFLRRRERFPEAITILTEAVNRDEGSYGTERQEIVETTLVHAKWQLLSKDRAPEQPDDPRVLELRERLADMRNRGRWNPHAYVIEANILLDIAEDSRNFVVKGECVEAAHGLLRDCLVGSEVPDEQTEKAMVRATSLGVRFEERDADRMEKEQGKGSGWYVLAESKPTADEADKTRWLERAIAAPKPSIPAIRLRIQNELKADTPNYARAAQLSDLVFHTLEAAKMKPRWHDHLQRVAALVGAGRYSETRGNMDLVRTMTPRGVAEPWPYFLRTGGQNAVFQGRVMDRAHAKAIYIGLHDVPGIESNLFCNPERSKFRPSLKKGDPVEFEMAIGILGLTAWDVRQP